MYHERIPFIKCLQSKIFISNFHIICIALIFLVKLCDFVHHVISSNTLHWKPSQHMPQDSCTISLPKCNVHSFGFRLKYSSTTKAQFAATLYPLVWWRQITLNIRAVSISIVSARNYSKICTVKSYGFANSM